MDKEEPQKPIRRKVSRIPKWTPVIVRWIDAVTVHDPMHSSDLGDAEPVERSTIGFLLNNSKTKVTICMEDDRESHDPARDCQTVTSINKPTVVKIERLYLQGEQNIDSIKIKANHTNSATRSRGASGESLPPAAQSTSAQRSESEETTTEETPLEAHLA